MTLAQFESALAAVADTTISSVAPSGGFATFLQKNPSVAALFSIAIVTAHSYLSNLESPGPASVANVTPPPPPAPKAT